ncbi:sigma-54-dependent Fis family transcriptional regulator [Desulfotruncus alcoholivorax]|uniref:sigma-54-dependent Fis family transcriptional regulator n=1 Tax=Desulfotruncus alcoholivorax TaxID=265477 RepID=UPI0004135357|nr:sigma-54-dependent Fis family transcriptional regulator [Desulfotruncus alcoholivorax]
MALPKVGVMSPNDNFSKAAYDLACELGINLIINKYDGINMEKVLKKWENGMAVEAVVTGSTIAALLRGKTKLPVVPVRVSGYDVLAALNKAKSVGRKVVMAEYEYLSYREDISGFASMLGMDVQLMRYREREQLVEALTKMRGQVDAVVASALTAIESARVAGLPAFLVQDDPLFIRDALEKAVQISRVRRRNAKLCRSLQAILDNAYDGILGIDELGKVVIYNPVAERIIGLSAEKVLGQPLSRVIKFNGLCRELIGDGGAASGKVLSIYGLSLVVNRVPITLGNQSGLVVIFQVDEKIKKIDTTIKKEINRQGLVAQFRFSDILGRSAMIEETVKEARKYTRSDAAVLITGESGTGKELFAQSIHNESARRNGPFVAINCAALPESLLESELFGYEDGAFTGARKGGKQGLFAISNGGTIFLDEIGDLSPSLQARLLRVLQQKEVLPVGGTRVIPVDVRVISATNRNLQEAVEKGEFRIDLFYRLNVLHLHIPPLRMRLEDVPLMFKHFYRRLTGNDYYNELVLEDLKTYLWPGNVRELEGFVERYVALGEDDEKGVTTFRKLLKKMKQNRHGESFPCDSGQVLMVKLSSMEDMERQVIEQAADIVEGGKGELAKILGLSRTTLWKKLKKAEAHRA